MTKCKECGSDITIKKESKSKKMFSTPKEQIARMLEINKEVWKDKKITEKAIKALGKPPRCPKGLYCVSLFYETGNVVKTFKRNWEAAVYVLGEDKTWKWSSILFDSKSVKSRSGAKKRPKGLRWAICELGKVHQGKSVADVRLELNNTMGMGQELPFLAALHPNWAVAMNGKDIPFVDAPDLQVAPDARGEFYYAPCLGFSRDDGRVELIASHVEVPGSYWGSGSLR